MITTGLPSGAPFSSNTTPRMVVGPTRSRKEKTMMTTGNGFPRHHQTTTTRGGTGRHGGRGSFLGKTSSTTGHNTCSSPRSTESHRLHDDDHDDDDDAVVGEAEIFARPERLEGGRRRRRRRAAAAAAAWWISNGLHSRAPRMSQTFLVYFIFTLCLLVSTRLSTANPTRSSNTCGQVHCKAVSEPLRNLKFHFKSGAVYNYMYTVNGTIFVDGGPSETSGLHLSANTTIWFVSPCDAILYMKDVELWQSVLPSGQDDIHKQHFTQARTSQTFKESVEQFPLRFSFADGLIEEICPENGEPGWVLNIKRGLLSAFQNTMRRLDLEDRSYEDDVNGRCKVEYRLGEATSSSMTIEKVKDLNSCGDRFGISSTIQGTPYSFGNLQQSMPAVDSIAECSQVVDRNLLVEISCLEKHHLKPLSQGVSGIQISVTQALDLITVYPGGGNGTEDADGKESDDIFNLDDEEDEDEDDEDSKAGRRADRVEIEDTGSFLIISRPDSYISEIIRTSPGQILRRESLAFHHEYHVGSTTNDYNTATNALVKFCQAVKMNVDRTAGPLYEALVHVLRGLSPADMMHLSREASTLCEGDRSLFDNVLEAVGSAASVGVIKDRILSGDAPRETISSWINSLTFIPKPDLALMAAAVPILKVRDNYPNVLLSYSSLAHTYCRQHGYCGSQQPVQILHNLYDKFFNITGCRTRQRKHVDQMLMYLKGIGNFGMFSEGIHTALQTCILSNDKLEIRVAAIEAYRRMPCGSVGELGDLRRIFENPQEDAELRIAAFLAIMKCPTYPTIRWLKRVHEKEQIRQVTSFVSSYIRNLQESSLPSKLELQGLVADEKFNDPFSTDFRQFSKNFEASAFYPVTNLGMGLDSNLIFSQASYIPRSSSLNLTVDLFGESINVFEATVRLESFEHYVESIFGPNGKLSGSGIASLLSSRSREKRAVPSKRKMRTLTSEYDAMRRYYSDPIMTLSLKTLGNEIAFLRKVGLDEQFDSLAALNPFQFLENLSNTKDSNWQKSTMLFDSSYIIPTGVGLPLNLTAQASSIMRFQAESMIDATNFRANPFQLKLKGKLVPSALITASAGVSLSAFQTHAGMKVRAQLRSSTALQGSFEVCGMELVDVEFGVPKSHLELLEWKSDVLFLQGDEFRLVGQSPKLKQSCNTGLLYKYMGLKVCTSSHFTLPRSPRSRDDEGEDEHLHPTLMSSLPFLVNGPLHFSLTLDKANPNLQKTRFHYQWNNNENITDFKLRTVRTTGPVSAPQDEELGLVYMLNKKDNNRFSLDVNFPRSTATAKGQVKLEKSTVKLDVRDKPSGKPYLGLSFSLDSVLFTGNIEDQDKGSSSPPSSRTYTGTGEVYYKDWKMELAMQGSRNESRAVVDCKGGYTAGGSNEIIMFQLSATNQEQRRHGLLLGSLTDTKVALDFSQFPDYNTLLIWKSQISEDGYQNDIDFRQGTHYLTESAPTTFRVRGKAYHESNHETTRINWMFLATQPSQQTDWGVEASFGSHGKSFDSAISFRYAPGKSYGTSLALKRKPGIMLLMDLGWNVTVPNSRPLMLALHVEEKAPRIYQAQHKLDWFGTNELSLDIEFSDRSRRNKVDTSCTLMVATRTIDNLKLGFHYLSEEKETKLQLNSEYHNRRNAFEAGHIGYGGKKHKLYASVTRGEIVYLVMSELDFEHGLQCSIQTDLGPGFSNILSRIKATNQNGLKQLNFEYSWDAGRDRSKQFLFEVYHDSSRSNFQRFEGLVSFPGHNYYSEGQYTYNKDDRSRLVMGRLKWEDEEHLHVNAQLVPRISDHEAYDVLLEVATPFELVKNVSFNAGIKFFKSRQQCLVDVTGSWGDDQTLSTSIQSNLEPLHEEAAASEPSGSLLSSLSQYKFTLENNMTSSIGGLESLRVNLHHSQFSSINFKTDLDVQLPNEKEISVASHLVLPESFSDLLSTRAELHIKTPFVGYQNLDLQAILGRKEDKDMMALIGIYVDSFQYSVAITGTPRFEEDGALGFEMTTSNPKYDKIFGSFSYVIGDNSRLACQLGWPQVVVGLEAGFESTGWEEFQVYLTFSSPWMPVKNINTLAKIDRAQFAEIKLELNEYGINAKSEWVVESWTSFDVRLDGSTPFEEARTFGGVLKHSWDDPATFYSQIAGWVDDHQAGYKLEGGTSEKEEGCGFATVRHATLEVDTVVYPTVRTTLNFSQMDIKYNLDMSILLREGPINVGVELEVLDVLRFNEKIQITTPYPELFELEINLNPVIVPERSLYNLRGDSKWRSDSTWKEGGLVLRVGPQSEYAILLQQELEDRAFTDCGNPEDDTEPVNDDYGNQEPDSAGPVDTPKSQLFHFHSPLKWANVVKLEYELVSESLDSDVDGESQDPQDSPDDIIDQFPLRNFALVYQGGGAAISAILQNEALRQTLTASIDTPTLNDRLAVELDCSVDLSELERKLNFQAISRHPTHQKYSVLSQWNNQLPQYLSANVEVNTPIDKLEQQSGSLTYAHNVDSYTADLELVSVTFDKLATNFVIRPRHFSMTLNTPFEHFQDVEMRADTTESDQFPDKLNSLISIKNGEKEIEIDVDSEIEDGWPTKINGTVSATFGPNPYRRGNLKANVERNDYDVNANGEIMWENADQLKALLYFRQSRKQLEQLEVKVDTTVRGLERWELKVNRTPSPTTQVAYSATGITPFRPFATLEGTLLLEMGTSWLELKKFEIHANAPNGSISAQTSWLLDSWNNFEVSGRARYNAAIGSSAKRAYQFLRTLPEANSLSFNLGNIILPLNELGTIDSKAVIEIQQPYFRGGQSVLLKYQPGEELAFKSATISMENSTKLSLTTEFDESFATFSAKAKYQSSGQTDSIYGANCNWEKNGESFDGEAGLVWGSVTLGRTSIHSKFNCSVNEASQGVVLHARVSPTVPEPPPPSPAERETDGEESETTQEEDEAETSPRFNPLDNPMLTMDGTFNKISGRHSARVQFGQTGLDKLPLVTEAKVFFRGLNEFDGEANFTSGIDNFTSVGLRLGNTVSGNVYSGIYGGHWEADEGMVKYWAEIEDTENVLLFNVSVDGVLPISTESVPRPQRTAVDVFYKGEAQSTESALKGVYNGVELLRTNYKSSSMSAAGLEKENTQLEFQNHFWPFGYNHTYQYEYSGGTDGHNFPTKSVHFAELYNLNNATEQRLEGELDVTTNFTGKRIHLTGTHPSRKVHIITDYNWVDRLLQHTTSFSWKQDSWMGYELSLMNGTKGLETDHRLALKLNYPIREIHFGSGYSFDGRSFKWTTDLNLNASQSNDKLVGMLVASLDSGTTSDTVAGKTVATLKHPSFAHDVVAAGELTMVGLTSSSSSPGRGRIDGIFSLEYSDDPTQRLILNWDAKMDLSEIVYGGRRASSSSSSPPSNLSSLPTTTLLPYWELKTNTKLQHVATNLDLKALYSTQHSPHELSIITLMDFKNSVKNANQEWKMAFELFKESKQASLQMNDPEGYALFWGELIGQYPEFVVNGKCNVTGMIPSPEARFSLDLEKSCFRMYAVHGKDLTDGIFAEGALVDSRNAMFDVSESYDNYRFSDVNFYLKLNHSKLITSRLSWRPELFAEIRDLCVNTYNNATARAGAKCNKFWKSFREDASQSVGDIWKQVKPSVAPFLGRIKDELNFSADIESFKAFLIEMYDNNEMYLQNWHNYVQLIAEEISAKLKTSFERYKREMENPAKLLERAVAWIAERVQEIYTHVVDTLKSFLTSGGEGFSGSFAKLRQLFVTYLNDVIQLAEKVIIQIYQSVSTLAANVYSHIAQLVDRYRPDVLAYFHQLEKALHSVSVKILDFFYETKETVLQSPYYQKLASLTKDLDELYKDFKRNSLEVNFRKYYAALKHFVGRKLTELSKLQLSLGNMYPRVESLLNDILETEVAQDLKESLKTACEKIKYLIEYTEVDVLIPKLILTLISQGKSIFFMTAIDTASTFEQAKTKFIFDTKKGVLSLEQKLPMPLAAFNETPNFRELPEYKAFQKVQDLFQTSDGSIWDVYYKIKSYGSPLNLIPPFEGHAMLVGSDYFFTFDGLVYNHSGPCVHLLAADLVDGNFSVSLQYRHDSSADAAGNDSPADQQSYTIIVASGHNTLIIDLKEDGLKDPKRGLQQTVSLPIQMANLRGFRDAEILVVESPKGLTVSCNMVYRICQIKISGWYSRKLAGVLGTMDMESYTDTTMANGKLAANLSQFFNSWDVSDDSSDACVGSSSSSSMSETGMTLGNPSSPRSQGVSSCHRIFQSKHSSLQPCFSKVKADPFIEMCLSATEESQSQPGSVSTTSSLCTSAFAYASQCRSNGVWVKIPSACIKCDMNGETLMDRDMKVISSPPSGSPAFRSTDVVFIVEAKECNRALRTGRKIDTIVNALEEELNRKKFKENRYAAVVYGGNGVFEKPHPIVQNGQIFTTPENISAYITSAVMGNGNKDTFRAIWYSLQKLDFRAGVSKTFILLPCSTCNPKEMTIDFSVVHYAMLEQDAKLHILMNNEFLFDNKALAKNVFGYDASLAFTKSDGVKRRLRGNALVRPQVFLPRRILGYCAPLALETNGTIFSGKKLQNRRENIVSLFTTVFSRRVVQTATPADCQTCYCLSNDETGVGKTECFVCGYPRYKPLPDGYDENLIDTDSDVKPGASLDDEDDHADLYEDGGDEDDE